MNNSQSNLDFRFGITKKMAQPAEQEDEFDYEQYHQEKIKQQQIVRAILRDVQKELPKIQKTGEIDKRFGITKSEVDLIEEIAKKHKSKMKTQ